MEIVKPVILPEMVCSNCGHKWNPRVVAPIKCWQCGKLFKYDKKEKENVEPTRKDGPGKFPANPTQEVCNK